MLLSKKEVSSKLVKLKMGSLVPLKLFLIFAVGFQSVNIVTSQELSTMETIATTAEVITEEPTTATTTVTTTTTVLTTLNETEEESTKAETAESTNLLTSTNTSIISETTETTPMLEVTFTESTESPTTNTTKTTEVMAATTATESPVKTTTSTITTATTETLSTTQTTLTATTTETSSVSSTTEKATDESTPPGSTTTTSIADTTSMGPSLSTVTSDSNITNASTIITTASATDSAACSSCNYTVEYCGKNDTCLCRPGYSRRNDECIRSKVFYTILVISQYNGSNASLSMISNEADEEDLRKEIILLINSFFRYFPRDFFGSRVLGFRSGSIVADIFTYFNLSTSVNETRITDVITDGFQTQNQSTIMINSDATFTQAEFDECELNVDDCHELAVCNDTEDYFMCTCSENTIDQLQGELTGRLCEVPGPTSPEMDMSTSKSTSEGPDLTTAAAPEAEPITLIAILLIAAIGLFLVLVCCVAFCNSRLIARRQAGFDLEPVKRKSSIKMLGFVEKDEMHPDEKPFKIDINEGDGLFNSTSVEAVDVLGESVYNPVYATESDVAPRYEMTTFHTTSGAGDTDDVARKDPTYAEPDTVEGRKDEEISADGVDRSFKSHRSELPNDVEKSTQSAVPVEEIYAKPLPKSKRTPSKKDSSTQTEEEPNGQNDSVGLEDLAAIMEAFPSTGARKLSAMYNEDITTL